MAERDAPDILNLPPLVSVMAPLVAVGCKGALPFGRLPPFPTAVFAGAGLLVLGVSGWLAVLGVRAFAQVQANFDQHKPALVLVNIGSFRVTRNPMYLGRPQLVAACSHAGDALVQVGCIARRVQ